MLVPEHQHSLFSLAYCCFLPQHGMDAFQWTVVSLCIVGLVVIPYFCILRSRVVTGDPESQGQNQQESQSLPQHQFPFPSQTHHHPQSRQHKQNESPTQADFQMRSGHRSQGLTQPRSGPQSQNQSQAQKHPHSQSRPHSQSLSHSQGHHQTQNGSQIQSCRWPRSRSELPETSGEKTAPLNRGPMEPSRDLLKYLQSLFQSQQLQNDQSHYDDPTRHSPLDTPSNLSQEAAILDGARNKWKAIQGRT